MKINLIGIAKSNGKYYRFCSITKDKEYPILKVGYNKDDGTYVLFVDDKQRLVKLPSVDFDFVTIND